MTGAEATVPNRFVTIGEIGKAIGLQGDAARSGVRLRGKAQPLTTGQTDEQVIAAGSFQSERINRHRLGPAEDHW